MRKMLKGLSVLQIVIGILCAAVGVAMLALGDAMGGLAKLPEEQQALTGMKVSAVLGLFSAVFNFSCGWFGLKGAKENKKSLSLAVKLGWLGLVAALVSGALALIGDAGGGSDSYRCLKQYCAGAVPNLGKKREQGLRKED